jgi:hypothetical protein
MHHQVQQFSDIRLKSLALTRCVRHCQVAFVPVAIAIHEFGGPSRLAPNFAPPFSSQRDIAFAPAGYKAFALSVFYPQILPPKSPRIRRGSGRPAKPRASEARIDAVFTVEPRERIAFERSKR